MESILRGDHDRAERRERSALMDVAFAAHAAEMGQANAMLRGQLRAETEVWLEEEPLSVIAKAALQKGKDPFWRDESNRDAWCRRAAGSWRQALRAAHELAAVYDAPPPPKRVSASDRTREATRRFEELPEEERAPPEDVAAILASVRSTIGATAPPPEPEPDKPRPKTPPPPRDLSAARAALTDL